MSVTVELSGEGIAFERDVPRAVALEILEIAMGDEETEAGADADREGLPADFFDRLTERQAAYVRVLLDADGWLTNAEIRRRLAEEHDLQTGGSQGISGIRSGFSRKYGTEFDLDERNWLGEQNEYRLNPAYVDELRARLD